MNQTLGNVGIASDTAQKVARAMMANAITQGVGVATGLQQKFDWRGVAAAGAGTYAGQVVGGALSDAKAFSGLSPMGQQIAQGTVRGFAAGTVTALARGGKVNAAQIAVDAFGNALGESLASASEPRIKTLGEGAQRARISTQGIEPLGISLSGADQSMVPGLAPELLDNRALLNAAEQASNPGAYISVDALHSSGAPSRIGAGPVADDGQLLRDFMRRDDPALRAYIAEQIARGKAPVDPLGSSAQKVKLDMEGSDGPTGKEMRNEDGYWRDKGRFSKSPARYDPIADRSGAGGKAAVSIDFKWEDKLVKQAQPFGDFGDDLLVWRGSYENTGKIQFSMVGAEASFRLGVATELQYARDSFQTPGLDKAEISVRSVADVGAEGKLELGRRSGGISAAFRAEAVGLQAQGVAESSTIQLPGGAEGKIKAVGALNAFAVGGSGKAYLQYENATLRAGLGASASALFGAGVQVNAEIDMNKFTLQKLAVDVVNGIGSFFNIRRKP